MTKMSPPSKILNSRVAFVLGISSSLLAAGCAIGPNYQKPAPIAAAAAPSWNAPLPHDGKVGDLQNWWSNWDDPILSQLIARAQQENSSVGIAAARIKQSRASYAQITSNLFPSFTGRASDIRSRDAPQVASSGVSGNSSTSTVTTSSPTIDRNKSVSLDAAWELDVVGGARRGRAAGAARLDARESEWHDARISIAAEVATTYVNLRACEVLLQGYELDANSRAQTARLTRLKEKAGFEAPANAALSDASAAEARARLMQQKADCAILIGALAELTAMNLREIETLLSAKRAVLPIPQRFAIREIPADAISQRPDIAAAEYDLIAASNDIGLAMADRFPRISLTGSIGYADAINSGIASRGRTWSWGPQLSLPIFDAGRRAAVVNEARAGFDLALANYQGKTLRAVREVEEALLRLDSANKREADANSALSGYQAFLKAADARVKAGGGSLPELEEARRAVVAAQGQAINVQRERLLAWVSLYRAVGGGWRSDAANTSAAARPTETDSRKP